MTQAESSPSLGDRIGNLLHQGNVRRLTVGKDGHNLVDLPLTIVLVATILAPWLAGIGLVVAVVTGHSISMHNTEDEDGDEPGEPASPEAQAEVFGEPESSSPNPVSAPPPAADVPTSEDPAAVGGETPEGTIDSPRAP